MEERYAQLLAKIEADNSMVEKLFALENANEVQDLLKADGLDFSLDEINVLKDGIIKVAEKGNNELSDEDLEDVAGGFAITVAGVTAVIGAVCAVAGLGLTAANVTNNLTRGRW